jgi:hypothetical protein
MSNLPAVTTQQNTVHTYDKVADPMAAATQLGEWICRSGMFGADRPEQGNLLALQCIVERKPPLELAKHYHVIQGRLSLRADAMLALYRERGGKVIWKQFDAAGARAQWIYDGNDIELAYTADDAKAAGFLPARGGSGWAKFPAEMMRARLISKAVRMLCPEVVTGTYTPEEIADFAQPSPVQVLATQPQAKAVDVEVVPTAVTADEPKLTLQAQVVELLAKVDLLAAGREFLIAKGWITAAETIKDLSESRAAKILAKPEAFTMAVAAHKVTTEAA